MASFAEIMAGSVMEQNQKLGSGLSEAVGQGIQLAQQAEEIQQKRAAHKQAGDQLAQAKLFKAIDFIQKIDDTKDEEAKAGMIKMAPHLLKSLEYDIPKEHLDFLLKSPSNRARIATAGEMIRGGQMTTVQFNKIFSDPTAILQLPEKTQTLLKQAGYTEETINGMRPDEKTALFDSLGIASGKRADNEAEMGKLGAQQVFSEKQQTRTFSQQDKIDTRNSKEKLGTELVNKGITELRTSINAFDKLLPNGLEDTKLTADIPGVTGIQSKIPVNKLDERGKKYRQAVGSITNAILKARSGGAVSDGEAMRALSELGVTVAVGEGGGWKTTFTGAPTTQSLLNGIRNANNILKDKENVYRNSYGADVYEEVTKGKSTEKKRGPSSFMLKGKPFTSEQLKTAPESVLRAIATENKTTLEELKKVLGL